MGTAKVGLQGSEPIRIDDTGLHDFVPSDVASEFKADTQATGLVQLFGAIEIGVGIYRDGRFSRGVPLTAAFLAKAERAAIWYDCLPEGHPLRELHTPEKVCDYLTILRNQFFGPTNCPYS